MNKETLQLIADIRQGDRKKAADLFNPELQGINSYLHLFIREKEQIQSCLKKAVQQAYLHLADVKEEDNFSLWLLTFARAEVLKILDTLSVYERPQEQEGTEEQHNIPSSAKERSAALLKELNHLTPYERAVTVLYLYDNLTANEIALLMKREQSVINALIRNSQDKTDYLYLADLIASLKPKPKLQTQSENTVSLPPKKSQEAKKEKEERPDLVFTNRVLAIDDSFLMRTQPIVTVNDENESRKDFYDYEQDKRPLVYKVILILILVLIIVLLGLLLVLFMKG